MLLLKALLVAVALARGKGKGKGKGSGRVPRECKDLEEQAYSDFLINGNSDGLLDKLETGTMYCTMNARYAEWPGCPQTEDPTDAPIDGQRRNLKRWGKDKDGDKDRVKYNKGRFTMAAGTTSSVQVEFNSETDTTYQCFSGDEFKFTVDGSPQLDGDDATVLGRRLLKRGGKPKVTASLSMTQTGTSDAACDASLALTCSVSGMEVVNGVCNAVSVSCETPKDSGSDTMVKMTCYENEDDVKGWKDVADCSADDAGDDQVINLAIDP